MPGIRVHLDQNRCSRCPESVFTLKRNECSRWTGIRKVCDTGLMHRRLNWTTTKGPVLVFSAGWGLILITIASSVTLIRDQSVIRFMGTLGSFVVFVGICMLVFGKRPQTVLRCDTCGQSREHAD